MNTPEFLKRLIEESKKDHCPLPDKGATILEHIELNGLFPNTSGENKYLVAWQEEDASVVHFGFSSKKDKVPNTYHVSWMAERFFNDPFGEMSSYLSICMDTVSEIKRLGL